MPLPVPAGVGAGAESGGSRKVRSGEAGATRRGAGACGAQGGGRAHRGGSPGGGGGADECGDAGEGTGASAIAEEPVVADVLEAPGEAVQEEAPQELDGVEGHRARAMVVGVVLPPKGAPAVGDGHQTLVADGDPGGVAGAGGEAPGGPRQQGGVVA